METDINIWPTWRGKGIQLAFSQAPGPRRMSPLLLSLLHCLLLLHSLLIDTICSFCPPVSFLHPNSLVICRSRAIHAQQGDFVGEKNPPQCGKIVKSPMALWKRNTSRFVLQMFAGKKTMYGTCTEVCICHTGIQEVPVCARRKSFSSLERHQFGALAFSGGKWRLKAVFLGFSHPGFNPGYIQWQGFWFYKEILVTGVSMPDVYTG